LSGIPAEEKGEEKGFFKANSYRAKKKEERRGGGTAPQRYEGKRRGRSLSKKKRGGQKKKSCKPSINSSLAGAASDGKRKKISFFALSRPGTEKGRPETRKKKAPGCFCPRQRGEKSLCELSTLKGKKEKEKKEKPGARRNGFLLLQMGGEEGKKKKARNL